MPQPPAPRPSATLSIALVAAAWFAACDDPRAPTFCGTVPEQSVHVGETTEELRHVATSSRPGVATASVEFHAVLGYRARVEGVSPGESTITMTVRDLAGEEAAVSFLATVTANQPPEITRAIPTRSIPEGDTVTVLLSGYFEDPDGDPLTFTARSSVQVDHSLAGDTLRLSLTGVGGIRFVTVTATDPGGLTARQDFLVKPAG